MIPILLKLKGIYSYQEEQVIDFSKLTANHLFGIFGGVGSGKSTILEAITYALYGNTERLSGNDKRSYNMMNLKSNELAIDFIFSAGREDKQYRFTVTAKRNKKHFDQVGTYSRNAYVKENDTWLPLDSNKADDILGLSYDNFRRTIIIPQGKFQEFLQLGDTDRTKMLQEIFRLEKFDLSEKVKSLNAKNEEALQFLQGRLAELASANRDTLTQKEHELNSAKIQLADLETKSKNLQSEIKSFEELHKLFSKKEDITIQLTRHKEQEEEILAIEQDLNCYLHSKETFENDLNNLDRQNKDKALIETEVANAKSELTKVEDDIIKETDNLQKIEAELAKKTEYLKQIENLQTLIKIKDSLEKSDINEKAIAKANFELNKSKADAAETKLNIENLKNKIQHIRGKKDELAVLKEIEAWYKQETLLLRQISSLTEKLSNLEKKQNVQKKGIMDIYEGNQYLSETPKDEIESMIITLEESAESIEKERMLQRSKIEEIDARTAIAKEVQELKEGMPCPYCGSTTHPAIRKYEHEKALTEHIVKTLEKLDADYKVVQYQKSSLSKYQIELKNIKEQKTEFTDELSSINAQLSNLSSEYKWNPEYKKNSEKLKQVIAIFTEETEEYDSLLNQLKELEESLNKATVNIENLSHKLTQLELERASLTSEQNTLKNALDKGIFDLNIKKSQDELLANAKAIEKHVADTDEKFTDITAKMKDLERNQSNLVTTINLKSEQLQALSEGIAQITSIMNNKIADSTFDSLDSVRLILNKPMDKISLKEKIETYKLQKAKLENSLHELTNDINDRKYDKELHLETNQLMQQVKDDITEITEKLGSVQHEIAKLTSDLRQKEELEKEDEKLNIRKQNIQILSRLFQKNGFVNYISTVYLQQLCNLANKRFAVLTNRQLELILNEKNNFEVRDYMNEGKSRSVKTLSGGQTFQASLSLALSLAESVQAQAETNQNFFFLDEGFGSLDKNSLSMVFNTLKTLRNENRIVGLISHVEELQEEVDVFLKLENDIDTGTKISKSWAD